MDAAARLCPRRPEVSQAAALFLSCLVASLARGATAGGLAAHFCRRDGQLQALSYPGPWDGLSNGKGLTVQAWIHLPDARDEYTSIFAYGVRNPLMFSVAPSELGLEMRRLGYQENPVPIISYKGETMMPLLEGGNDSGGANLGEPDTSEDSNGVAFGSDGYRVHVTATIDYANGEFAVYLNGTMLYGGIHPEKGAPAAGGELMLGAEFARNSARRGHLVARRPACVTIDNFRIFDRALSATEVAASLSANGPSQGLLLSWEFDAPFGDIEEDMSGNGNHGRRGAVPDLSFPRIFGLEYEALSTIFVVPVVPPRMVMSHTPPSNANGTMVRSVALVPTGQEVALRLVTPGAAAAKGAATVVALPSGMDMTFENGTSLEVGSVVTSNDIVLFPAPSEWPGDSASPMELLFSVDGEQKTTEVYPARPCEPPNKRSSYMKVDEWLILSMGGVCDDGAISQVEVLDQPAGGYLMEILSFGDIPFAAQGRIDSYEDTVQTGMLFTTPSGIVLRILLDFPFVLPNKTTNLLFVPFQNLTSPIGATVRYRWLSDYASSSVIASAAIRITPRNQPPALTSPNVSVTDSGIHMQLRTQDADGSPAGQGAVIYEIVRGPRFGTLRQVGPDKGGAVRLNEDLGRFGKAMPTVEHMAASIPGYDSELGPAWSSQDSVCGECCWKQETCNEHTCGLSAQDFEACTEDSRTIRNLLGEELDSDAVTKVFSPHCSKCGRQWFVFGIEEPLYVMSFKIYMFGVRGIVSKISAAETYSGSRTQWVNLYESQLDNPAMKIESVFEYEPQVCNFPALKAKYFRVEYDTDLLETLAGFHAVKVEGSLTRRDDALWNENGRLWYQPTPGIYLDPQVITDDFEVVANDCADRSQPVTVKLPVLEPGLMSESSVGFGTLTREVSVELGTRKAVQLDISDAAAHLYGAFGGNMTPADFTVKVQLPRPEDGVRLYQHDSTPMRDEGQGQIQGGIDSNHDGNTADADAAAMMVQLSDPDFHFTIEMPYNFGLTFTTLHFTATSRGVLYHIPVIATGVCPENSLPTECATRAFVCKQAFGDKAVFNIAERRCELLNEDDPLSRFRYYFLGFVSVVLFCLVVAAYCIFRKSLRGRLSGTPGQGEKVTLVITDIHGSTTLWENFPGEMAVDIALHHECLRASLKKCKGYEIATEGDSFKCAFRTPEDAICWSIVAQMDLLCAPWNTSMEDGGQGVLNGREDWADMERGAKVSENGKKIINSITSSEVMETTRTMLRKGHIREPLFSPCQAASTEFTHNWVERKGIEATCIHSSAKDPIPVFRGLRVRMGIHSGIAERVKIHELTKRYVYSGDVAETAKAVSDAPCGGQIIMSGETLAEVESLQELQAMVAERCAGWRHGEAAEDESMPAAFSVFSLGSHIIKQQPETRGDQMESIMLQEGAEHRTDGSLQSVAVDIIGASADSEIPSADSCVRSLEDESTLPAFGQTTRLNDLKKKTLTAARSTLQSVITSVNSKSYRSNLAASAGSSDRDVREGLKKSDQSSRGRGERPGFDPDFGQFILPGDSGPDAEGSELVGPEIYEAMDEFRRAHELIMVVPWMLKTRAMYYPAPSSIKALTPSWDLAPAAESVTIVFTFIERWQKLKAWGENSGTGALTEDLKKLQAVVRYQLVQHHGYEVEGEEGNFVCAFHSPADAVQFAVAIQEGLLQVNWSEELLSTKWCHEERTANGKLSFRGMRLAIGMCTGDAMRVQPCVRTGKMEYYGPIMNHAARVATAAHGGQVLMHEATWQSLLENINDYGDEKAVFSNMGKHNLKGIAKMIYITQAIPKKIQSRAFPPIKTLTTSSRSSMRTSSARETAVGQSLDQYLFSIGAISKKEADISAQEHALEGKQSKQRKNSSTPGSVTGVSLINQGLESLRGVFLPSSSGLPSPPAAPRQSSFRRHVNNAMRSARTVPVGDRSSLDTMRAPSASSGGGSAFENVVSKVLVTMKSESRKSLFSRQNNKAHALYGQSSYSKRVTRSDFHLPPLDFEGSPTQPDEDSLPRADRETS